jgi:hypothetical protein
MGHKLKFGRFKGKLKINGGFNSIDEKNLDIKMNYVDKN